jgi:hypothetical protein
MGGWFLDVYVAYLFKLSARMLRRWRSRTWPLTVATVASARSSRGAFGCSTVEVIYTYSIEGHTFGGASEKPFISPTSADNYAARFPVGSSLVIRLKPADSTISVVCDKDQIAVGEHNA